jgi:phosphoglucomutase
MLVDVARLERAYYDRRPDMSNVTQHVVFGTSGHRGTSSDATFTEQHILAITQAVCDYRKGQKIDGPLFLAKDTHALSAPAQRSALEVLAANGVQTMIAAGDQVTAVPIMSRAVINYNRGRRGHLADALAATPSHNPPTDGGFKYNTPNGGPADTSVTKWIQQRANELLKAGNRDVKRIAFESARKAPTTHEFDFITPYVRDLAQVIDMEAIRGSGVKVGVDPLGGASLPCWEPINAIYNLNIEIVNRKIDPTFSFMTVDHDGKIRMDCSSPYAMASLVGLKDRFQVAFGNDPDSDRHGIVTPSAGLMNPNHYLAVAIEYLLTHRRAWSNHAAIGKTVVSSSMIDRVVQQLGRKLVEVPVGFKWFVDGLFSGSLCFGGEESAGASFVQKDGSTWTTDKDGILLGLLAAEITATTGKDPGVHYQQLTQSFGAPLYTRIDAPANASEKAVLSNLSPAAVQASNLAGEPIIAKLTQAPGNNAPIGGLKVMTQNGWFAARPSGTENVYKLYAESFKGQEHLDRIVSEAKLILRNALSKA